MKFYRILSVLAVVAAMSACTSPDPDTPEPDVPEQPEAPASGNRNGWLVNYEIPYVDVDEELETTGKPYSSTVKEKYGNTNAYIYEVKSPRRRVVTHTFRNTNGKTDRNYTLLYDYDKKNPEWIAYHSNLGFCPSNVGRSDSYGQDPAIPSNAQPSTVKYGGAYNRGHMMASHSRLVTTEANKMLFYYTNITPQNASTFNTGGAVWNCLEDKEKANVPSGRDTVYVVCGTHYEGNYKTLSQGSAVPTHFYKCFILMSFDKDGNITSAKGKGYYFDHTAAKSKDFEACAKTIDEIEKITGYDFFASVPEKWQTKAESEKASLW